jgi:5-methylthioadenosine/S-adenosylhomocysteine deaminase
METVDLIIHARWLVPILPKNTVLEHHSIVVHQGQIIALLPQGQVMRRYTATIEQNYEQH